MLIKCPHCATDYKIPHNAIGQQPRKMRCTRCKTIFTVTKKGGAPHPGYEEFAGRRSALPANYTYLRESHTQRPPDPQVVIESQIDNLHRHDKTLLGVYQREIEAATKIIQEQREQEKKSRTQKDSSTSAKPLPRGEEEQTPTSTVTEDRPKAAELITSATKTDTPEEKPIEQALKPHPQAATSPAAASKSAASRPSFTPNPQKDALVEEVLRRARERDARARSVKQSAQVVHSDLPAEPAMNPVATPARPSNPVAEIYSTNRSAWEAEAPLELGDYAVSSSTSTGQLIGKVMSILIAVAILFLLFVAYRNDWSLTISNLREQTAFAFSGQEREELPDAVQSLEVVVEETKILFRPRRKPLLLAMGKVFNNSPIVHSHVILRAKIYDAAGELRTQVRFPCDKIVPESKLKKIRRGRTAKFYKTKGKLHNCTIRGESNVFFQLILEDVPPDYDKTFRTEVKAISTRIQTP